MLPATAFDVAAFFAGSKTDYDMVRVDGIPVAMGAFHREGTRTWVFLNVKPHDDVPSIAIVRGLARGLRRRGGVIHCICDAEQFPNAPRLLRALGFRPTVEVRADKRVWEWQA